ncbi:neuronal acetylcholine receptor subunit alpha-10-like [Ptychodera flava]|uniref:neuronal acetylcholine receptor subunit alpha-10-like n=1 Tax=Ptychodera flava TaxID=63121 RepID=UPI003969BF06
MTPRNAISLFVLALCTVPAGGSNHANPYSRLSTDLLDGYDKFALPVLDASEVLTVEFGVCLHQIADMDEKQQQFTVAAFIQQTWRDQYLSWDIHDYDGITELRLPADKVWRPDTAVFNNMGEAFGRLTDDNNVVISYDGTVVWLAPTLLRNSCKFDTTYVPFDKQRCELPFASWSYEGRQLELVNATVRLDNYREHGEWQLVAADIGPWDAILTNEKYEMKGAVLSLALHRRPQFCLLFVIVPFIMIGGISLLVFLLPAESGEKISLCITNLLTLILFYVEISHKLPATSDGQFPLLGSFHFVFICLISASCVLTILVLNIYHRTNSQRPIPVCVRRLFFGRWGLQNFVWYVPGRREEDSYREYLRQASSGPAWPPETERQSIVMGNSLLSSSDGAAQLLSRKRYEESDRLSQGLSDIQMDISQALCRLQRIESRLMLGENPRRFVTENSLPPCSDWQKVSVMLDQLFFIILFTLASLTCLVFGLLIKCS